MIVEIKENKTMLRTNKNMEIKEKDDPICYDGALYTTKNIQGTKQLLRYFSIWIIVSLCTITLFVFLLKDTKNEKREDNYQFVIIIVSSFLIYPCMFFLVQCFCLKRYRFFYKICRYY